MHVTLIGGGRTPAAAPLVFGPFLEAVRSCAGGKIPRIDVTADAERYHSTLTGVGACEPFTVPIPLGSRLRVDDLSAAHGLLVCGGLTPAYAEAIVPVRDELIGWLEARQVPYCGFSAGAAIAARHAVVGGWLLDGQPVCPEDTAEDLEEVTVVDGLGLVEFSVEVHATQWGTTPRLQAALTLLAPHNRGYAVDEDTALIVEGTQPPRVVGLGQASLVAPPREAQEL
jgi:cyanophycinase